MSKTTRHVWALMSQQPNFSVNDVCRAYYCVRSTALIAAGIVTRGDRLRTFRVVEKWAWVEL